MSFAVGDRVVARIDIDKREDGKPVIPGGLTGTVIYVGGKHAHSVIAVCWDIPKPDLYFHSCGGLCKYGYGYTVLAMDLLELQEDDGIGEVDEVEFLRCVMCERQ